MTVFKIILHTLFPIFTLFKITERIVSTKEKGLNPVQFTTLIFKYKNLENYRIYEGGNIRYEEKESGLKYTGWAVYEDIMFPGT